MDLLLKVMVLMLVLFKKFVNSANYLHLELGSDCISFNGVFGVCTHVQYCNSARRMLENGIGPDICAFNKLEPIVCCEDVKKYVDFEISSGNIATEKCNDYNSRINSLKMIGVDAKPREFPHVALLGYEDSNYVEWKCGGALISEYFILTAAHCLYSRELGPVKIVRLGDFDIRSHLDDANARNYIVTETFSYPEYSRYFRYHDIALLRLEREVNFNDFILPACLGTLKQLPDVQMIAAGWGQTSFNGVMPSKLQKTVLNETDYKTCSRFYKEKDVGLNRGIVDDWQICAEGSNPGDDTCQGDSGTPLLLLEKYNSPKRFLPTIVGVTSFGIDCGLVPSVYTRVSYYINWIEKIVWTGR